MLVVSYFFYGWWDWRFLLLITFSSVVDYTIGILLEKIDRDNLRKLLLVTSLLVNLGILGSFKYFNFFVENFTYAFSLFGKSINPYTLKIILPVGISFYTFQTLSYSIDVYKRKMKATSNIINFFAFVSFFPQLVAGPIERASNLLPQFFKKREFKYSIAVDGLKQIMWGLFKKIVIADNCAKYANEIFSSYSNFSSNTLVIGAVLFAFQIYGDFSGYSDIAIGTSKLFGFNLMRNFDYPYFSRSINEFWRKWHISLSTWFRDYIYYPLGGNRCGMYKKIRNTFVIFVVSGFWHGANWTFIIWGILNALYIIPGIIFNKNKKRDEVIAKGKMLPNLKELVGVLSTFTLTLFAWIFFRAESVSKAISYISKIFSQNIFESPNISKGCIIALLLVCILIIIEWFGREQEYAISKLGYSFPRSIRLSLYYIVVFSIFIFAGNEQQFVYFQF